MQNSYHIKEEHAIGGIFSHLYLTLREKRLPKDKKKRVIVIAGPTGVGKTKVSMSLARAIGGEIISADSMQIYRGMDIGTAKVSQKEREEIPHHLIDIVDIQDSFNVVDFYNRAHIICKDILLREKVPIIVGGSGFYLHAFLYGPPMGPPSILEIRQKLEKELKEEGAKALYQKLKKLDPSYAATLTENDRHKIVRGLEIIEITKMPVSSFPKPDILQSSLYDYACWFLYMPKEILYSRVDKRCQEMVNEGFIEEVERLELMGLRENITASQAIGYRQCLEYLISDRSDEAKKRFIEDFKQATRHYVKRQFTWFKKESLFRWLNIYEIDFERAVEYILQDFEQGW
jgi:tRNA dimethylallyltransferase